MDGLRAAALGVALVAAGCTDGGDRDPAPSPSPTPSPSPVGPHPDVALLLRALRAADAVPAPWGVSYRDELARAVEAFGEPVPPAAGSRLPPGVAGARALAAEALAGAGRAASPAVALLLAEVAAGAASFVVAHR